MRRSDGGKPQAQRGGDGGHRGLTLGVLIVIGSVLIVGKPGADARQKPAAPAAQKAPPLRDPRFPYPVAPTTLSDEQLARLDAMSAVYTVDPYPAEPGKARSQAEQATLDKLSAKLAKLAPVPAERQAYFAWMNRPDSPIRFRSWGCFLLKATPRPGGWTLQVQAMPRARDAFNNHIDVYNRFIEEYTLTEQGCLRYIRGYPHPADGPPQFGRAGM